MNNLSAEQNVVEVNFRRMLSRCYSAISDQATPNIEFAANVNFNT
jgi:hypothetical protein